ncbi:MAG: GTP-binding protein, partial [Acidobacteria bacterium]|nr:GTP-binding protein [Acidobacteriota bacterium]
VAVNKVDSPQQLGRVAPFYRLGIKSVFGISAEHGLGVDELLDHFAEEIPEAAEESTYDVTQVAIIGRPNVGKSTLLNQLVKEERSIVSVLPGTTRDSIDAEFRQGDDRFRLIDTAGIRRKAKTKLLAEKLSVIMARKHLEASDVALLLLDASDGVSALDSRIGGYAHESGRSVILVVNKWDAVKRGPSTTVDYTKYLRRRLKYLDYAPVIFLSALTGRHVGKLGGLMAEVARERLRRLSPAELETFVEEVDWDRVRSPRKNKGQVHRVTQAGGAPPSFFLHTGGGAKLHYAFERFVENRLRERFGFLGAPILIRAKRGR